MAYRTGKEKSANYIRTVGKNDEYFFRERLRQIVVHYRMKFSIRRKNFYQCVCLLCISDKLLTVQIFNANP
jgi:hypothetical protein